METRYCSKCKKKEVKAHLYRDSSLCPECARIEDNGDFSYGIFRIWGCGKCLSPLQVHKIIANYLEDKEDIIPSNVLELKNFQIKKYLKYAFSLDAIAPAWDKLSDYPRYSENGLYYAEFEYRSHIKAEGKTIQEASSMITALAILEELGE